MRDRSKWWILCQDSRNATKVEPDSRIHVQKGPTSPVSAHQKCYATSRKVTCSIPDDVIDLFFISWAFCCYRTLVHAHIKLDVSSSKLSYPRNRPCKPIGFWDVEDPTLSRQSARRWLWGCEPYAPAALYTSETILFLFWYSFMLEAGWTPGPSAAGRLDKLKKITSSGHEPATFRLVA
jgi:hypothetical protein